MIHIRLLRKVDYKVLQNDHCYRIMHVILQNCNLVIGIFDAGKIRVEANDKKLDQSYAVPTNHMFWELWFSSVPCLSLHKYLKYINLFLMETGLYRNKIFFKFPFLLQIQISEISFFESVVHEFFYYFSFPFLPLSSLFSFLSKVNDVKSKLDECVTPAVTHVSSAPRGGPYILHSGLPAHAR